MLEVENVHLPQKTVVQGLVRELRNRLLSGSIKGGEAMKQEQLAKQFGVSRIPVREALLQLEAEGLVRFAPHKGAVATELSLKEAEELFHLRVLLETDVLARAFSRLGEKDLTAAERADTVYAKAIEEKSNPDSWGDLNWTFHRILYEPADRPRTMGMIRNLHISTDRYQRVQLLLTGGVPRAEAEHRAILSACHSGNRDAAIEALRTHISSVGKQITRILKQK